MAPSPKMLIQDPRAKVLSTSDLRMRLESSAPALRYLYKRLDKRVYPNDQKVLRNPATTPNSVR